LLITVRSIENAVGKSAGDKIAGATGLT
jgi:hypothetical protein